MYKRQGKRDVVVGGPYFWGANGQGMWQAAAFKDHMDYFRPEDTESVFGPNVDAYYPRVIFGGGSSEGGKNTLTPVSYTHLDLFRLRTGELYRSVDIFF